MTHLRSQRRVIVVAVIAVIDGFVIVIVLIT
jgi:hypothetical protein